MKFNSVVKENIKTKKMEWNGNPEIGFHANKPSFTLYYGINANEVESFLEEGIHASNDGYITCAAEPNTAFYHSALRAHVNESRVSSPWQDRAVLVLSIPKHFLNDQTIYTENDDRNHFDDSSLYESWGKSDAEYYSEIEVLIPSFIAPDFITKYMVKTDG